MEIFTIRNQKRTWPFVFICLMLTIVSVWAQNTTVSGTVRDERGETLPGVNVILKGTNIGATTDSEGRYTISVAGNGTLVFSFVGYMPIEESINNRTVIDISLTPDIQTLNEIVVIGYGTQTRETVTGSIATIKAEDFNAGQINDPMTLIAGKVAGLSVSNPNRADPNATTDFSLRGPATVEGNSNLLLCGKNIMH